MWEKYVPSRYLFAKKFSMKLFNELFANKLIYSRKSHFIANQGYLFPIKWLMNEKKNIREKFYCFEISMIIFCENHKKKERQLMIPFSNFYFLKHKIDNIRQSLIEYLLEYINIPWSRYIFIIWFYTIKQ